MATSVPPKTKIDDAPPRLAVRDIPSPAKASAVKNLADRLRELNFTAASAMAIAQAVVDPSDVRRRLQRPTRIRVPGAVLDTVDADVWTPAVVPYVANYREADSRIFPTDTTVSELDAPKHPPILRPKGNPNGRPILDLEMAGRDHLVNAIQASITYLVERNPMKDSIAEKGVMFPVTLVATSVDFGGGKKIDIPATNDGSSRAANALDVLGIDAEEIIGRYLTDARALSGLVGRIRSIFGRSLDEVSEEDIARANALILPARIVIGFEPDATGDEDFAKASHNYVQLVHGDLPPQPWPETARIDAKADSVVAELEEADLLTPKRARFFEGMLSPAEAKKARLPEHADERGLLIVSTIASKKSAVHEAIKAGIVQPSRREYATKRVKVEICAELALRGTRAVLTPKAMADARAVLENVYANPVIWEKGTKSSGSSPDELLKTALKERKAGEVGPATMELAALGVFWLTARRALREARFFSSEKFRDGRTPNTVLSALIDSDWGLQVLARSIKDGRDGDKLWRVDADGNRIKGVTGDFLVADNDWIRGEVVPPEVDDGDKGGGEEGDGSSPPLPVRVLLDRRKRLEAAVLTLEQRHEELREVKTGAGEPLVDQRGLPTDVTEDLRNRLETIRTKLAVYGNTWSEESASADGATAEDETVEEVTS